MFKKLKREFEKRQRVNGLSKAMAIVDDHMIPGLTPRALDCAYGQAYAEIRSTYINGEVTENEMYAALVSLDNQHDKLRRQALMEELMA